MNILNNQVKRLTERKNIDKKELSKKIKNL